MRSRVQGGHDRYLIEIIAEEKVISPECGFLEDGREELLGMWEGTYYNVDGINGAHLEIFKNGDDVWGIFSFFPVEGSTEGQRAGSYIVNVEYEESTQNFYIFGEEWIDQPGNWNFVNLRGKINGETFSGNIGFSEGVWSDYIFQMSRR